MGRWSRKFNVLLLEAFGTELSLAFFCMPVYIYGNLSFTFVHQCFV